MKYKVIAKNGLRIDGKRVALGDVIDAPKKGNIDVAIRLKQIEPVAEAATEKKK